MINELKKMTGFYLDGKQVGAIAINGKDLWSKLLSVSYYDIASVLLSTVNVNFNSNAPILSAPEVENKRFIVWDKKLTNIITDLSTYPVYKDYYDVTYQYASDKSVISSQKLLDGDIVKYIDTPAKKNFYISNFIPENSFDVSPISSDLTILVNDIKNEIKFDAISTYNHDADFHSILLLNVRSEPGKSEIAIHYALCSDIASCELSDISTYNLSNWSRYCPLCSIPSITDICIRLSGNNTETKYELILLSIGDAKLFDVNYYFKLSNDSSISIVTHQVFDGHNDVLPELEHLSNTISSTFVRWNNYDYKNVRKNSEISAVYKPRIFNITYFDISSNIIDSQQLRYGDKSVLPTEKITIGGYKHLYWIDTLSNLIPESNFDFVSTDISAYTYQKKICNVALYLTYGDKNILLSTFKYLSGDVVDLSNLQELEKIDVYNVDPYFKFVKCIANKNDLYLSATLYTVSALYIANNYDYDLFRASYILKYKNEKLNAKFKMYNENDRIILLDSSDDLYSLFKALYILKYSNNIDNNTEDNISSASISFSKFDSNDNICVIENEDNIQYAYDKTKFHDRTAYVLKYSNITDISANFQLNKNRIFTLIIEDDILKFIRSTAGTYFRIRKLKADSKIKFEYMTNNNLSWKLYDFHDIVNPENNKDLDWIKIRAFSINTDLDNCIIETDFSFDTSETLYTGKLQYLTSKYGESVLPNSYYIDKIHILQNTSNVMSISNNIEKPKKITKRRKRKSKEIKNA